MNARIKKEFRALVLPWTVGAAAALLIAFFILCNEGFFPGLYNRALPFLIQCATFVAALSIPILAAMSFGAEYQQRTLPLLLAQPEERSQLWREKMITLATTAASVALIVPIILLAIGLYVFGRIPYLWDSEVLEVALMVSVVILATICSTGYWTMVARSIIGGLAFSLAAQFLAGVTVGFGLNKIYGDLPPGDSIITGAVVVTGLAHSAIFLWLGRRKFIGLEVTDIVLGEGIGVSNGSLLSWSPDVLRCRADSPLLNLVRKELRFQRTVFVIAGVLFLCWLVSWLLSFVAPIRKNYFEGIFGAITSGYIFLLPVLAGTISLGEERTLGLTAWHLTLPVSARLQWFVKVIVSIAVAFGFGLLVPYLLINLTAATGKVDAFSFGSNPVQLLAVLAAISVPFLLSFWAVTFFGNPIKAVVAAVIAAGVFGSVCQFGAWCADKLSPIETGPVSAVVAWLQLPVYQYDLISVLDVFIGLSVIVGIIAILAQSFIQFRRIQSRPRVLVKNAVILAVLGFLLSFWCVDVLQSLHAFTQQVYADVAGALGSLSVKRSDFHGEKTKRIPLQDLERTGHLSDFTKMWLRNASITISISEPVAQNQRYGLGAVQGEIVLPNGSGFGAASSFLPSSRFQD